jgi:hypothetical protein
VLRGVTEVANELTISRIRTQFHGIGGVGERLTKVTFGAESTFRADSSPR